jgi:hypothetical protein
LKEKALKEKHEKEKSEIQEKQKIAQQEEEAYTVSAILDYQKDSSDRFGQN